MTDRDLSILQIPLYRLYHPNAINDPPLSDKALERWSQVYSRDCINKILEGLEWAFNNPTYRFSSLLPGLPVSDEEAFNYLMKLRDQLKPHFGGNPQPPNKEIANQSEAITEFSARLIWRRQENLKANGQFWEDNSTN